MNHWKSITGLLLAASLAGCAQESIGTSRNLGAVGYDQAFGSAVKTMAQYFAISDSDSTTGTIQSQPKPFRAEDDRLLGGYPARQIAVMRLRREEGQVVANLSVEIQRQRAQLYRMIKMSEDNYDTVPNETPAQKEAATTIQQNQSWETQRYSHELERQILDELHASLHPAEP